MEYLTPEDYKRAEENGIRYLVAYKRFYEYGWEKEKTITHPIIKSQGDRVRKYSNELFEQAKANGISENLFYRRINKLGWTPERAASEPKKHPRKCPFVEQAKENGIKVKTYYNRLDRGWTKEEASTTPALHQRDWAYKISEARRKYPAEMLETAKENGIKPITFYQRVLNGWTAEDASTIPLRYSEHTEYLETAQKNDIQPDAYYRRVQRGWSKEEASTIPPYERKNRRSI